MHQLIRVVTIVFLLYPGKLSAAERILHYSETSGFDHGTRTVSFSMFEQIAMQLGYEINDDITGDAFNILDTLLLYKVIVFSNTSGNAILDPLQQANFEQYINSGGNVIGIHAASDTYRHSTANGALTGTWDFYPELIGASVQESPNHVNGTPVYTMTSMQNHPLLTGMPLIWPKAEEYYYWENGYFDSSGNQILYEVETTIGPNGLSNSYDSARATCWYRIGSSNNRIFYTSLGHDVSNFTTDTLFRKLLTNALQWTATGNVGIGNVDDNLFITSPNPFCNSLTITFAGNSLLEFEACLYDVNGDCILKNIKTNRLETASLLPGVYILKLIFQDKQFLRRVVRLRN
jgi:type 1 glutamine amidotransferase